MSSIGPQLPANLSKRKRTPDDEGNPDSPPTKRAPTNQDEITLGEESSEDEYGPSVPKSSAGPSIGSSIGPSIGPSMGPTLPASNDNEIPLDDDSDSDSDSGPAPPSAHKPAPSQPVGPSAEPARRILGPAPPPGPISERPPGSPNDDSDDSDDDYGPALPTSNAHMARQSQAREAAALEAANPKAPVRDDWMLAPPTAGSARAADPTKIKARKFNSGPRGGGGGDAGGGAAGEISSIWTETPEQKRQRLENAVLGRSGSGSSTAQSAGNSSKMSKEEQTKADEIRANLEAARGPSLYAAHQQREGGKGGRIEAEEDDPSKRGFDWEKDMRSGSKIGSAQRKELMNKAADFGGRFSKGKFL